MLDLAYLNEDMVNNINELMSEWEKEKNTLFVGLEGLKFNQDAEVLYKQIVKE